MTGYSFLYYTDESKNISISIKSLNSKVLDVNVKLPNYFKSSEPEIRKLAANSLVRGKIDIIIDLKWIEIPKAFKLNEENIKNYFLQLQNIKEAIFPKTYSPDWLMLIFQLPFIYDSSILEASENEINSLLENVQKAIDKLIDFRINEGKTLTNDMLSLVNEILQILNSISLNLPSLYNKLKEKFLKQIELLKIEVKEDRLEQEIFYYLDKLDIHEELVRLNQHCNYFLEVLKNEQYAGKKLNFIAQEMFREANTISNKCQDFEIQKSMVRIKEIIEKLKEQLANVL